MSEFNHGVEVNLCRFLIVGLYLYFCWRSNKMNCELMLTYDTPANRK